MTSIDPPPSSVRDLRRATLWTLFATILMVGGCSATGTVTGRGGGADLIARSPLAFAKTISVLRGSLLFVQLCLVLLARGKLTTSRLKAMRSVPALAIFLSLATAYAGFVAAVARLCSYAVPTLQEDAACAAGGGSLAAIFSVIGGGIVLAFVNGMLGRLSVPPPKIQDQ